MHVRLHFYLPFPKPGAGSVVARKSQIALQSRGKFERPRFARQAPLQTRRRTKSGRMLGSMTASQVHMGSDAARRNTG